MNTYDEGEEDLESEVHGFMCCLRSNLAAFVHVTSFIAGLEQQLQPGVPPEGVVS